MSTHFKPSRLAVKISIVAFAISIVWTLLCAGTLLFIEYKQNKKELVERLREVCETQSAGLSQSLWDFDNILLKTQLKALVDLPTISSGKVKDANKIIWQSGYKNSKDIIPLSFQLNYSDRGDNILLGSLEVTPDFSTLHDDLASLAFKIFVSQAINSFAIAIVFLFLFYFLAGRHLAAIASQASSLNVDNLNVPIQLSRTSEGPITDDELDVLEKALNHMRTNLAQALSTIRISEERYRKLFEIMPQGVVSQDTRGQIISVNPSALKILDLDEKQALKRSSYDDMWDLIRENGEQVTGIEHPAMVALTTGQPVKGDILGARKNSTDEYRWLRIDSIPLFDESSKIPYQVYTIFEDITDRKKAVETLECYAHIISSTNDMMYFLDTNGTYQAVNQSYLEFYNKKREDIIGHTVEEVIGARNYKKIDKERIDRALNGEKINFQSWLNYPHKGERYMDLTLSPFKNTNGQVTGVVVTVHELTELKETEDALRSSEEELRNLIENINDVIYAIENNGKTTYLSPRIKTLLGYDPMISNDFNFSNLAHHEDILKVEKHIQKGLSGEMSLCEFRAKNQTGETRWIRSSHHPFIDGKHINGLRGTLTDITEQKELEDQLFQAQKMDAIGQLAGGIAHDFNNMLGGITGAAEILSINAKNEERVRKYANMIFETAERAAGMTSKLLTFARNSTKASTTFDVHQIIKDTIVLLNNSIDRRINLLPDLQAEESIIVGDPSQLQNVFLNLGINSSHAMPEGGNLTFSSSVTILDKAYCDASSFNLEPGRHLLIKVQDTGAGIPLAHQHKIFEPFFTTKEQGKGTGLGLAASYGSIKQHHGSIVVYSEEGNGTIFHLLLPLAKGKKCQYTNMIQRLTGTGNILVVDDEEVMRSTAKMILEDLGYTVETATDGKDAIEKYLSAPIPYDLVVLDMIMPKMNGRDCFQKLQAINPEIRVVLSSGFSQEDDLAEMKSSGLKGFVRKPYRSVALSKIIHDALQQSTDTLN